MSTPNDISPIVEATLVDEETSIHHAQIISDNGYQAPSFFQKCYMKICRFGNICYCCHQRVWYKVPHLICKICNATYHEKCIDDHTNIDSFCPNCNTLNSNDIWLLQSIHFFGHK